MGLLLWYRGERREHDWRWAVLYGATLGVCIMTRATNIVPICGGVFIICVVLIKKRYLGNLLQNAFSFMAGMFCVVMPFTVYFGLKGLLYDMFYASIIYKIDYAKGSVPWVLGANIKDWAVFLYVYVAYYVIFVMVGLSIWRRDYVQATALCITGLLETYLFTSGYAFRQYPLICLAQIVCLMNEAVVLADWNIKYKKWMGILIAVMMGFFMIWKAASSLKSFNTYSEREWKILVDEIPSDELSSFVAYGGNELKEVYLLCDVMPCYKYFAIQEWQSGFTEVVKNDVYRTFENGKAKWILTDCSTTIIDDVLESRYKLWDSVGDYRLFKLDNNT